MRRLVLLSALLVLGGLTLLLPSSPLYSLLTSGSVTSGTATVVRFGSSGGSSSSDTTTIESLLGFGLIGVGLVLEVLSMFTDVGGAIPNGTVAPTEKIERKQA